MSGIGIPFCVVLSCVVGCEIATAKAILMVRFPKRQCYNQMRINSIVRKERMEITTESDINGEAARWLRGRAELPQHAFWASVGVKQPTGANYELGNTDIPQSVRILVFIKYAAGIEVDASTVDGAKALGRLAIIQEADKLEGGAVTAAIADALHHIKQAGAAIKTITKEGA
jgi:hypothetical protein